MKNSKQYKLLIQKTRSIHIFRVIIITLLVLVAVALISVGVVMRRTQPVVVDTSIESFQSLSTAPFEQLQLDATAVVVYDILNNDIVYESNSDDVLSLASITKIMTAMVALDHGDRDQYITLSSQALAQEGNNFLLENETWKLGDLVEFMLVTSSNDAAYEIARSITIDGEQGIRTFVNEMNHTAQELGLVTLSFASPSGLDIGEGTPTTFGSARDIAHLLSSAVNQYPDIFSASAQDGKVFRSLVHDNHIGQNTNVIARQLPALIASKTGYTDGSGGNLAIMFDVGPSHPFVIVVLGSGFDERFVDMKKLVSATVTAVGQTE